MEYRIIDISRTLEPETAPWPGDTPFAMEWTARIADGSSINLSAVHGSPHVGTHADAPLHVREGAAGIDRVPLEPYIGPVRVVAVSPGDDGLIHPESIEGIDLTNPPRLLLRTGTDPDSRSWPGHFAALAPDTARRLGQAKVLLVGLDTPSVDPADSKELPAHHALLDGGVHWLENLDLSGAEPGLYWLVALPLKIRGADAAPVRAVLIAGSGETLSPGRNSTLRT